ncbi:MAG: DUF429 domain-containing protein [Pseudomonadota bacterium]
MTKKASKTVAGPLDDPASVDCYGLDGCKGGWVCAHLERGRLGFTVHPRFSDFIATISSHSRIYIDIPIGLQNSKSPDRMCDIEARQLLRPRRSASVFNAPVRDILYAKSHRLASEKSRELTGKGISQQTFNIINKIIEVDESIRSGAASGMTIKEAHPELCFFGLNNQEAMQYNKKTQQGRDQRLAVLAKYIPKIEGQLIAASKSYPRRLVALDDFVDAAVTALAATLHQHCVRVPTTPQLDPAGIPMEILYPLV